MPTNYSPALPLPLAKAARTLNQHQPDEASSVLARAMAVASDSTDMLFLMGLAKLMQERGGEAVSFKLKPAACHRSPGARAGDPQNNF